MTGLTALTMLVILAALAGRLTYGQALAIGGATPSGAALVFGSVVVPTFYAVAIGAAASLALAVLASGRFGPRPRQPLPPGGQLFVLFLAWSVLVTLTAPLVFDQQPLVHPVSRELIAGTLTTSNLAQIAYMFLGVCVVVFLARSPSTGSGLLGLTLGLCLALSLARYLALQLGLPFPEGFFDNSPNFIYIETAAGGFERVRGIHAEPAALALTCVTGIAYFGRRAAAVSGVRRAGCLTFAAIAAYLGVVSTSATFVVAGLVSAGIFLAVALAGFLAGRSSISLAAALAVCAALVTAVVAGPAVVASVRSIIGDKLVSSSFDDRASADSESFGVFLETYGFGVGLGSARASSFVPTLLSAVGLVGSLLLVAAIVTIVRNAWHDHACRPTVWALVAYLAVKVTSNPDLSDTTGILWISLGVLSHAGLRSGSRAGLKSPTVAPDQRSASAQWRPSPQPAQQFGDLRRDPLQVSAADQPEVTGRYRHHPVGAHDHEDVHHERADQTGVAGAVDPEWRNQ